METNVDIETLPISEWKDLVRHILFRYRNKRCRCRMSDIANIKADVGAHLWYFLSSKHPPLYRFKLYRKATVPAPSIQQWYKPEQEVILPPQQGLSYSAAPLSNPTPRQLSAFSYCSSPHPSHTTGTLQYFFSGQYPRIPPPVGSTLPD
jgi:hypothetical protein